MQNMNSENPKVFISYSWEDNDHKAWVKELANRLISDGIDATVDQYDLQLGDRLPHFMENAIVNSDYVLIICTPNYKKKSDARTGGVGYEGHIISDELFSKGNERKFIPVIRKGSATGAMPSCLAGKLGIDLTVTADSEHNYQDLITTLYGANKKPKLGKKPSYVQPHKNTYNPNAKTEEPIHILGIITDEVTVPKMDGTRGSALYKIPFRLSSRPSEIWKQLFLQLWSFPPSFSTMHRPGIASVYGDKIILDGTTIEEVRDTHRATLILCVDEANKREAQIIAEQKRKEVLEQQRKNQHFDNVNSIADDIKF